MSYFIEASHNSKQQMFEQRTGKHIDMQSKNYAFGSVLWFPDGCVPVNLSIFFKVIQSVL